MAVCGLKDTKLPVIKLMTSATAPHTITLSAWMQMLTILDPQWVEEYDTPYTLGYVIVSPFEDHFR